MKNPKIIDLHNHVIPLTFVNAVRAEPTRFGMRIEDRDGKIFYERRGKFSELRPVVYDAEAKLAAMDEMGIDIAALDVSATSIRAGLSTDIPEIVAAFIRENALYDN